MLVLIPQMFIQNPVISLIGILSGFLYLLIINGMSKFRENAWMLAVPFISALINAVFTHKGATILFFVNDTAVTLESVLYGFVTGMMISAVLIWFAGFTQLMTTDKLLYVFGKLSPKIALILSMTLRYIPLFKKQIKKTNDAQKLMGLYKEDNAIDKIKGGMRIFSIMLTWALENGVITADSMAARGYGVGRRSSFSLFRMHKSDWIMLASVILLSAMPVYSIISSNIDYEWYPYILHPENFSAEPLITYISYSLLCIIPVYLHIKEEARWKSLQSKI